MFVYHRFPLKFDLRQQWISALRRKDFKPSKCAVVCSKHFRDEDFDRTSLSCVRLRNNAVPSVFTAFPSYLQTKHRARKAPKDRSVYVEAATVVADEQMPENIAADASGTPEPLASTTGLPVTIIGSTTDDVQDTPRKVELKRKLHHSESRLKSSRKKIKLLQQSKRRLLKRAADLNTIIADMRKNDILSTESAAVLQNSAGGIDDLLKRRDAKLSGKAYQVTYSPELRSFALTLHFYSPHAYRYVRKMFDTCLPHPRTIEKWFQTIDGRPGFTTEAFDALKARSSAVSGKRIICSLMMDEVAIRQQLEWDGSRYQGYIDMGTNLDSDSMPLAKEALTFMVVAVNDTFKLPVGYFLIDGLGGLERASLVNQCLSRLHDVGVTVVSLTFDGAAANLSMIKTLGCNLDVFSDEFKTSFKHPNTSDGVFVFLDPCHMLKLIRNTLGDKKSVVDGDGNFIKWDYIDNLHKLQDNEGLHLGNRLRSAHILWHKNKMNVRLAAQLLSESVAASLQFCVSEGLPDFEGCEPTIKFIRIFNRLFDLLTSRNLASKGYKRPMQANNIDDMRTFLYEAKAYIMSLKESKNGRSIIDSNRKVGFLGFCVCIHSVIELYDFLTTSSQFGLKFLCTFKLSQDHLELFFSKIRRLGGCNNNPSARQFISAYRKLVVHNDLQDVLRGNCLPLESVPILTATSNFVSKLNADCPSVLSLNNSVTRARVIDPDYTATRDHDYTFVPNSALLSACSQKICAYIAGFVVFKLKGTLHCEKCVEALTATDYTPICSLIKLKSKGGLILPSQDVINVCLTCEKYFRRNVILTESKLPRLSVHEITQSVLKTFINKDCFSSLSEHMLECEPTCNHIILLIKAIIEKYLQVRFFYAGKQYTSHIREKLQKISRHVSTKLVIFTGQ